MINKIEEKSKKSEEHFEARIHNLAIAILGGSSVNLVTQSIFLKEMEIRVEKTRKGNARLCDVTNTGAKRLCDKTNANIQRLSNETYHWFNSLKEKSGSLDEKVESIDEKIESLDEELESLDEKLKSSGSKFVSFEDKFESFENKFESFENKIESFENKFDSMEKNMAFIANRLDPWYKFFFETAAVLSAVIGAMCAVYVIYYPPRGP